jgi:hypothetical protein
MDIAFIHPDLGIGITSSEQLLIAGGAERLVIDAAVGLQERGHKATIYTSHCDQNHCFDEARDGMPPSQLSAFLKLRNIERSSPRKYDRANSLFWPFFHSLRNSATTSFIVESASHSSSLGT